MRCVITYICFFVLMIRRPPRSTRTDTLFPYTALFRSVGKRADHQYRGLDADLAHGGDDRQAVDAGQHAVERDRVVAGADRLDQPVATVVDPVDLDSMLLEFGNNLPGRDLVLRSAERRVGDGCVSTCRSQRSPYRLRK